MPLTRWAGAYGGAMPSDWRGHRSPLGLGPLEAAIMQVLWAADQPLMVREIRERADYPPVAYTTVSTVASLLCGKGLVLRDLIDPAERPGPPVWQYRAARSASEHIGELIAALLDRSPSPEQALAHALSTARTAFQLDRTVHADSQEHGNDV